MCLNNCECVPWMLARQPGWLQCIIMIKNLKIFQVPVQTQLRWMWHHEIFMMSHSISQIHHEPCVRLFRSWWLKASYKHQNHTQYQEGQNWMKPVCCCTDVCQNQRVITAGLSWWLLKGKYRCILKVWGTIVYFHTVDGGHAAPTCKQMYTLISI